MRKLLLSILAATTAAAVTSPALAQRVDRDDRAEAREERRAKQAEARKERSEARQQRVEQRQRVERPQRVDRRQDARQQNVTVRERAVRTDRRAKNVNERGRPTLQQRRQSRDAVVQQRQQTREAVTQRREQRQEARQQRVEQRQRYIEQVTQPRRVTPPAGARPDRPAPPPATTAHVAAPQWHTTWRHDRRYDWRRWRDHNRSIFRLGFYFDPFGWNYRRYGIGWRLWPSYYSSNYWLNDPFMYRLPYAPWPYRWVRYYDDALLVNTMTGQVVDVIYDFFW